MAGPKTEKKRPNWVKRLIWTGLALLATLILLIGFARIYITTSGGAKLIENQVNARSFGPLERIEISGLSGDPLDEFFISSVKIYDKEGLWFTANDVNMDWTPWTLLRRRLHIKTISVQSADLLRRPRLNDPQDKTQTSGNSYTAELDQAFIKAFTIEEPVIGQQAVFDLSGAFSMPKSGALKALLTAVRTDAPGDTISLDFARSRAGDMNGDFELTGKAGGPLATLLRAPQDAQITGSGNIAGTAISGKGALSLAFNGAPKIAIDGLWSETALTVNAQVKTQDWAVFDPYRRGLGGDIQIEGEIDRTSQPGAFTAKLSSAKISAIASGQMADTGLPGQFQIDAHTENLASLLPLPDGYAIGPSVISGRVRLKPGYAFTGDIKAQNITTPYGGAAQISGPLSTQQTGEDIYDLRAEAIITDLNPKADLPFDFVSKTSLKLGAVLDAKTNDISDISVELISGENSASLSGRANSKSAAYNVSGKAQLNLRAAGAVPGGQLQTVFTAVKTPDSLPAVSADGGFKPAGAIAPPFDQLFRGGVNFDIDMSPIEDGLRIAGARFSGENINAAIEGRITQTVDINGEALLSAPFAYNGLSLSGKTQASFGLGGASADPDIRLDAAADTAAFSGYKLESARLRAEVRNVLTAPKGPVRLTANTKQGPLDASLQFTSRGQILAANDISLSWGDLSASGQISKPANSPVLGMLSLNLPEDKDRYARANLTLSAASNEQGLALDIDAKNIAYQQYRFDSLSAQANGTLAALSGNIAAKGVHQRKILQRGFELETPIALSKAGGETYTLSLSPDAKYGNIVLAATAPLTARYVSGDIDIRAPLTLGGAPFDVQYSKTDAAEDLLVKASALPVSLLPMPGPMADTRGRLGGDLQLSSNGRAVSGGGSITLSDWRGFEIDRGEGITGALDFKIVGNATDWKINAQTEAGFTASGNGRFAHIPATSITGLRPDMNGVFKGELTAFGDAAALLGLVTPNSAKPGGTLEADLRLSGTAANPQMQGRVTGEDLRMEVPILGTQMRGGRFTANFTNDTLKVQDLFVSDAKDGTLTGGGEFTLGEFARPIGQLDMTATNFALLDRRDYEGNVDGSIGFESTQERAALTGDVTLNRVEVKEFVAGRVAVIEIPVEEINKPENLDETVIKAPPVPIDLDINLRAPRRIFVRSRGLDIEMSVDTKIKGTVTEPKLYGQAAVLRGGYKIAGKTLDFKDGNIVFDGRIGAARVDLLAVTETQNLSAQLVITGTVEKPQIKLSSTPERPQDEILSALLFGRSVTELSAIEAAQLAGALAQFSGAGGGFDLMGGLRDALGVGQLSIGVGEGGNALITGGRYLAKNVYLQVFSGGGADQTGAVIDWEIRKNLSLRSKIEADNDQSFSLKWKRDF